MNLTRLSAVSHKEFLHIARDPLSLTLSFAFPLLLLVIFGYALSLDVDQVPLMILDQSRTTASREFMSRFAGSRYFSLIGLAETPMDIDKAIDTEKAKAALVIPSNFAISTGSGRHSSAQLILDGSDANTATIIQSYAEGIAAEYSRDLTLTWVRKAGSGSQATPADVRMRVWFNPDLESKNFIIPGLMAVILMVVAALLIPLSIAREKENGTIELLISTPIRGSELVLGKMLPYFAIGMGDVLLTIVAGQFLFHVPLKGSLLLLVSTSAFYLIAGLSLGIYISMVARSQLAASQTSLILTFLPAFMLSGFISPISQMPMAVQVITRLFPARYFVVILKDIYMKGLGIAGIYRELLLVIAFAFVLFLMATGSFKKRLV